MKKHLILGAAILLSSGQDWAATPSQSSTETTANEKPESKNSISKDIRNGGTVNGPVLQDEQQREEELIDEVDNQDGSDRQDHGNGSATNPRQPKKL